MILRDYDQPQRLGLNMDAPCATLGWPNMLVHAHTQRAAYPAHLGPLSLKTVHAGRELNKVGHARFAVIKGRYLLLNDGQSHAHAVDAGTEVFTVMFRKGLAEEVLTSLATSPEKLLGAPDLSGTPTAFFERTYPDDPVLSALLSALRAEAQRRNLGQDELEERFHPLLVRLLELHHNASCDLDALPAVRFATRVELYRRLWRARDFIEASYTGRVTLKEIAAAAELSPHHLLRLFKRFFGETPHQLVTKRRLERARYLLRTGRSVTDTCFDVGFESLGSFSGLFKAQVGVAPVHYRAAGTTQTRKIREAIQA
ncbi:MAG: Transcriptional regulator, AraC family [uncultured Truepera sp.]|uniref:Transcriptional regulator, AraC family n=1 Tax=uncultured Truepera sp. TaxID=543023 RepID=A0A6J4VFK6_9DEIN|nr:MAG: Transcriptional regulator, AraC family [uncultured Truepera sp.]